MTQAVATVHEPSNGMIAMIERLAVSSEVDVDKLEKMLDMQERILAKQSESAYNHAMAEVQASLPVIPKTKKGHNSEYAPYDEIDRQVKPIYSKFGFSVSFNTKKLEGVTVYYGTAKHREGHSETKEIELPNDTTGSKNNIQAIGSTISYAKRYLLCMLFNIVTGDDVDDDGNAAGNQYISTKSAASIDNRINALKDAKEYRSKFLKYMRSASVREILASDEKKALAAIEAKEKHKPLKKSGGKK